MSDEMMKEQHSRRIRQKEAYAKKQAKIAKTYGLPKPKSLKHCEKAVLNCGNPKCPMCSNPRGMWKEKTVQELSFEQTEKWVDE